METAIGIVGLLLVVLGFVGSLAIQNDEKWPRVRDAIWPVLVAVSLGSLAIGFGAFVEGTLAEHEISIAAPALVVCIGGLVLLLALALADWLR